jgi:hypothetical protein
MCCNQSRAAIPGVRQAGPAPGPPAGSAAPLRGGANAYFQYLGPTAMQVRGPATGASYRFAHHGAIVGVDPRDSRAVAAVPALRRVAGP